MNAIYTYTHICLCKVIFLCFLYLQTCVFSYIKINLMLLFNAVLLEHEKSLHAYVISSTLLAVVYILFFLQCFENEITIRFRT